VVSPAASTNGIVGTLITVKGATRSAKLAWAWLPTAAAALIDAGDYDV
jgi:hypothetical protein